MPERGVAGHLRAAHEAPGPVEEEPESEVAGGLRARVGREAGADGRCVRDGGSAAGDDARDLRPLRGLLHRGAVLAHLLGDLAGEVVRVIGRPRPRGLHPVVPGLHVGVPGLHPVVPGLHVGDLCAVLGEAPADGLGEAQDREPGDGRAPRVPPHAVPEALEGAVAAGLGLLVTEEATEILGEGAGGGVATGRVLF